MSLSVGQNLASKPIAFGAQTEKKNELPKQAATVAAGAGAGAILGTVINSLKTAAKEKDMIVGAMKKNKISDAVINYRLETHFKNIDTKALMNTAKKAGAVKGSLIGAGVTALALVATKMLGGKEGAQAAQPAEKAAE